MYFITPLGNRTAISVSDIDANGLRRLALLVNGAEVGHAWLTDDHVAALCARLSERADATEPSS
jgi:hypothetical protein